jgi:hypothetical protein
MRHGKGWVKVGLTMTTVNNSERSPVDTAFDGATTVGAWARVGDGAPYAGDGRVPAKGSEGV